MILPPFATTKPNTTKAYATIPKTTLSGKETTLIHEKTLNRKPHMTEPKPKWQTARHLTRQQKKINKRHKKQPFPEKKRPRNMKMLAIAKPERHRKNRNDYLPKTLTDTKREQSNATNTNTDCKQNDCNPNNAHERQHPHDMIPLYIAYKTKLTTAQPLYNRHNYKRLLHRTHAPTTTHPTEFWTPNHYLLFLLPHTLRPRKPTYARPFSLWTPPRPQAAHFAQKVSYYCVMRVIFFLFMHP